MTKNVTEYLDKTAERFPEKTAFICGDERIISLFFANKSRKTNRNKIKEEFFNE